MSRRKELPTYDKLAASFPKGTADVAKKTIGGNINMDWVTNTCAVRVSHSLNLTAHTIPQKFAGWNPDQFSARGGNKKRYIFKVKAMVDYLKATYGDPDVKSVGGSVPESFKNKKGIIWFDVPNWSDATGHVDLWNGSSCEGPKCYFAEAKSVYLWLAP